MISIIRSHVVGGYGESPRLTVMVVSPWTALETRCKKLRPKVTAAAHGGHHPSRSESLHAAQKGEPEGFATVTGVASRPAGLRPGVPLGGRLGRLSAWRAKRRPG